MKKKLTLFLILSLLVGLITGCTKKEAGSETKSALNSSGTSTEQTTAATDNTVGGTTASPASSGTTEGRYIAESIPLPQDMTEKQLQTPPYAGQYFTDCISEYYTFSEDNTQFYRYRLEKDETWTTEELKWAISSVPSDLSWIQQVVYSSNGTGYLFYYTAEKDGSCIAHIIKQTSETTGEELDIPALQKQNANGRYPYPQNMVVDSDGSIYLIEDGICDVYSPDTYKQIQEYSPSDYIGNIYLTEDSVYFTSPNQSSIEQYDKSTGELTNSYPYETNDPYSAVICVNADKQLCLLVHEGIFTIQPGNTTWEMIYDGSLGILADPNAYASVLIPGSQNDFYFSISGTLPTMYHCFFDENAPAQPANTLTVYSLYDSDTIRKAISLFQTKYQDYKVSFRVATTAKYQYERDELDTSDYINALNTELLANGGSDVLILDGLLYQSYIEKGILANLSDYVPSLGHPEDFLSNIINSCKTDGKIYALPTAFRAYAIQGTDDVLNAADSIHSIAEYMHQSNNTSLFNYWYYRQFVEFLINLEADSLFLSNQLINQEDLTQLFKDIRDIQTMTENGLNYADLDTNDKADTFTNEICKNPKILYGEYIGNPYTNLFFCGIAKERNSNIRALHNEYLPANMVGITESSTQKEAAGNFIDLLLSEDLQSISLGSVYQPVRVSAIDSEKDFYDENIGGGSGDYCFNFPDDIRRQQIIDLSKSVNKLRPDDPTLSRIYQEVFTNFLSDTSADAESTASALYNRLALYYAE